MPPLSELPPNTTALVVSVATDEATAHQLGVLGLLPGHQVTVIKNQGRNTPLVVEIELARFALGREIAREISVDLNEKP